MALENGNGNSRDATGKLHAVIIPFPEQGHVTPCLQLAKKLVALHGFRITFVYTTHIQERLVKSRSSATEPDLKDIEFVTVSDGLPEDDPRLRDLAAFCKAPPDMGPIFEDLFNTLLRNKAPITCVIRDFIFTPVHHAAKKLNIPVAVFTTTSAISTHCLHNLDTFISSGTLPLPPRPRDTSTSYLGLPQSDAEAGARDAPLTRCLPGVSPTMRVGDIPTFLLTHDLEDLFIRFFLDRQNPLVRDSDCVLYNTFEGLEGAVLNAASLNETVFAVGPLAMDSVVIDGVESVSLAGGGSSALWAEDPVSLSWLDEQKPRSVLFISFGSKATVSLEQMREFAGGLEMSNTAFLWVIRPDLINTEDADANDKYQSMFAEFVRRTRDRALLVPWAPQTAVLSHPAVAAYLTHCGWNSTIESVSSGVPMLAWPRFGDQTTNCHYITSVWNIGLQLGQSHAKRVVSKEEIALMVRKIMADGDTDLDVAKIRINSRHFQMAARKAVANGGSSQIALAKFVELIARTNTPPLKILDVVSGAA